MPRSAGVAAAVAVLLASCAGEQPPEAISQPPPPAQPPSQPPAQPPMAAAVSPAGLTPLPSSNQVVASVASGRVDPFGPLANSGGRPGALSLPPGLVFNGVIRSGGTPEALVQFGSETGTLRVGQRGGRTTPLLPAGWSVANIDVQRGRLTLRQGKQSVTAEL